MLLDLHLYHLFELPATSSHNFKFESKISRKTNIHLIPARKDGHEINPVPKHG